MKKVPIKSVRMWLARDKDNTLWLSQEKPYEKNSMDGIWVTDGGILEIKDNLFPNVKWTDSEPTRVVLRLA